MGYFSNVIICVSNPVAEQFQSELRERKVCVVHNGFPKSEFEEVSNARIAAFREQFGLCSNQRAIGVVGRIKFLRKGQEIFAQSAALLKDHFPDTKFFCIGSPFPGNEDHLERLLDLIQRLGLNKTVIYTGDVDDPKAAMAAMDIVVLSSVQPEPFGGVVVEAMALGKPVVGTRIGGTLEQIEDGVTGLLVNPGDPAAMAIALATLLQDQELSDQMGKKGRERFMQYFEFEAFYKKIMNIYHSNLKKGLIL